MLLNVCVYASVRHFELVNWDDSTYITENPTVLGGLSWSSVWWALTTGHSPYWHPMTWLSHLLDVTLFGSDAGAYHVTNLVLHTASTVLLFEIFRRMTGALWPSAFVAAMFAVHPLHVESVAWIAERKDVLSTLFWMLTLAAYVGYVRHPAWHALRADARALRAGADVEADGRDAARGAAAARRLAAAAPWRWLADAWRRRTPPAAASREGSAPGARARHQRGDGDRPASRRRDGGPRRVAVDDCASRNATIGYVAYLWKTIWPTHLAAFYPLFEIYRAARGRPRRVTDRGDHASQPILRSRGDIRSSSSAGSGTS